MCKEVDGKEHRTPFIAPAFTSGEAALQLHAHTHTSPKTLAYLLATASSSKTWG